MNSWTPNSWNLDTEETSEESVMSLPDIFKNTALQKLNRMRGKARVRNAPAYPLPVSEEKRNEIWFEIVYPSFKKLRISDLVFCQALEMYDEITSQFYLRDGEEICFAFVLIEEMIKVHCLTSDVGYLLGLARSYGLGDDFSGSLIWGIQLNLNQHNGWDLKRFIPYDFVKVYIEKMMDLEYAGLMVEGFGPSFDVDRLCPRLRFLLLVCCKQNMYRHYDPDFMAAILLIVYRSKFCEGDPWPKEMENFSGFGREDERFLEMGPLLLGTYDYLASVDWLGLGEGLL